MTIKRVQITLAMTLGVFAVMLVLLGASSQPTRAALTTLCVAPGGSGCDPTTCGGSCYTSVQAAVDAAGTGDEIRVAAGTYTGVQAREGMTQTVYISKTVTLRGGYNSNLTTWDPDTYTTTLDAQGQGRVVSIVGESADPTLEGFLITGGNANGVTLHCPNFTGTSEGCGGGIFVYAGGPTIVNNIVTHNVAGVSTGIKSTDGGGLCLDHAGGSVITGNLIISNTASLGARGMGGGIAMSYPYGVVLASNQVIENVATTHSTLAGSGGGVAIGGSGAVATIQDNLIEGNRTNGSGSWDGAGIHLWGGSSNFLSNRVVGNIGTQAILLGYYDGERFEANQVVNNQTSTGVLIQYGGSYYNRALVNNVIARSGSESLSLTTSSGAPLTVTLIHNTLIGPGTGYGVYVKSGYVSLALTNTIVANHTWGITNTYPASSTVAVDHTLFWANTQNGIVGTNPVYGDPLFVDFGMGGFHLGPGSAAIDVGVATTETVDIDGNLRPLGIAPDIGADEVLWRQVYLPLVLRN